MEAIGALFTVEFRKLIADVDVSQEIVSRLSVCDSGFSEGGMHISDVAVVATLQGAEVYLVELLTWETSLPVVLFTPKLREIIVDHPIAQAIFPGLMVDGTGFTDNRRSSITDLMFLMILMDNEVYLASLLMEAEVMASAEV